MKNESLVRFTIDGLSESEAANLYTSLRKQYKGAKVEIDNPEPEDLLEKEFQEVGQAFDAIRQLAEEVDWPGADCDTPAKVVRELKTLQKLAANIGNKYSKLGLALLALETAVAGLQKK